MAFMEDLLTDNTEGRNTLAFELVSTLETLGGARYRVTQTKEQFEVFLGFSIELTLYRGHDGLYLDLGHVCGGGSHGQLGRGAGGQVAHKDVGDDINWVHGDNLVYPRTDILPATILKFP